MLRGPGLSRPVQALDAPASLLGSTYSQVLRAGGRGVHPTDHVRSTALVAPAGMALPTDSVRGVTPRFTVNARCCRILVQEMWHWL